MLIIIEFVHLVDAINQSKKLVFYMTPLIFIVTYVSLFSQNRFLSTRLKWFFFLLVFGIIFQPLRTN